MIYNGIAKGNSIALDQPLPYPEGQPVRVAVEPWVTAPGAGFPVAILKAMQDAPHVTEEDVAQLERAIEEGKVPASREGVFDGGGWAMIFSQVTA